MQISQSCTKTNIKIITDMHERQNVQVYTHIAYFKKRYNTKGVKRTYQYYEYYNKLVLNEG